MIGRVAEDLRHCRIQELAFLRLWLHLRAGVLVFFVAVQPRHWFRSFSVHQVIEQRLVGGLVVDERGPT